MNILDVTAYLDGGTVRVMNDKRQFFFIDHRLNSPTEGIVYNAYPSAGGATKVQKKIVLELIEALKEWDKTGKLGRGAWKNIKI